ncbi:MAG TPA: aspartate/glutamate racemase family protein [Methylomirabilota bacterium]|jgi:allantoin racemase|nr:aspartate/glutamate racemase family protein [Methylomirabilota bacterium]
MKLLVVNPNSSDTVTGAIMESARRGASPGTELIGVTTKGGTRNIDSAFGDYLSGAYMIRTGLEAVSIHKPHAVVLAGFGRVGIDALKEALTIPVVSIAEASMAMACLLGHRFTTLTMLRQFIPYQQDLVRLFGFEAKCASVRAINVNVEECVTDRERTLAELSAEIRKVVDEDRAEVVILACAGLCGYDAELSRLAGVPVLDPVAVAVKVAEGFVGLGLAQSKRRKFAHPPQSLDAYL